MDLIMMEGVAIMEHCTRCFDGGLLDCYI